MTLAVKTESRIDRLRRRYHDETPKISIERALYYTEKWKETERSGLTRAERVALSMKNVYENMTMYVDPDDAIAGYWTESFLGIPIDIERGVFNKVLGSELDKKSMLAFHLKTLGETASWLIKKREVGNFVKSIRQTRKAGPSPMNIGLETMRERKINQFTIDPAEAAILKKHLLSWWEGRTMVDLLEKELFASGLLKGEMQDFAAAIPANTSRQTSMVSACATISTYQGHVIIDYEAVIKKGLSGILDDIKNQIASVGEADAQRLSFLMSIQTAVEGTIIYARRLAEAIAVRLGNETDPEQKARLEKMHETCSRVPVLPAANFREAVQSAWTIKTAVELAHPVNLHCFGRMDQILFPYYEKDIASGEITRGEALDLLCELLLKVMSQNIRPESNILSNFYHRYLGSTPITVGGVAPDGSDGTNELTYLFIDAAEKSSAVTNLSVRIHSGTPDDVLLAVAAAMHNGCSAISIYNDDINVEAMQRRGFATGDARDYAVMGCVEMLCPGKTGGMSANALLLCRLMDMTLRNGESQTLMGRIKNVGLKTGDPDSFADFETFFNAFIDQSRDQVKLLAEASNLRDRLFADNLPAPVISAFIQGCLDKGKDVTAGGALYDLSGISFINSIANAGDSLLAIKKLIFEQKKFTFKKLLDAIDSNYEGYEDIHQAILQVEGKWGNGMVEGDGIVRRMTDLLFEETYKYESFRGGKFVPYIISMTTHTIDGRISIATPDGRSAATPFAASCNPYNVEKNGVTGAMKSIAAIDFRHVLGCAVNMKFHPSAVGQTEEARRKWASLIRAYFKLGGAQLQPTVASAQMMREAQKNPAEYRDLIVKVGGYSTYFVDLGCEIQSEVIARTEHGYVD